MTDEPTFVLPFHGVEDFPPESAPLAVKSEQATSNGLIAPVMFGGRTSQGILVSQTLATTQAIQAFFHRQSVAVPGAAVPPDTRTLGTVHIFPLELLTAPMVRHLSFNQPRFA